MMRNFIKQRANNAFKVGDIYVTIKDMPPEDVDVKTAIKRALKMIPVHLRAGIDAIYVGQFDDLIARELTAKYKDNALYLTNEQDSEEDVIDDVIHEAAHSVEEIYYDEIYGDNSIRREFIGKRKKLSSLLSSEGYDVQNYNFEKTEYDVEFDQFLYKKVGYSKLTYLTMELVYSPYGMTSLREYFANGFEAYFMHKDYRLKKISPFLLEKLEKLEYNKEVNDENRYI